MLLIERGEGVDTKPISTSYSPTAGTAYVTFEDVKVPVENLLGKEGKGVYVILSNFNHERLVMAAGSCRSSRFIVEECFKWAHLRKVFGKQLIEQPVIRAKFAAMFAKVEATQAMLEQISTFPFLSTEKGLTRITSAFQMNNMTHAQMAEHLAGPIGLLKMQCTRVAGEIADDAVQIFGGRGITKGGMGGHIEHFVSPSSPFITSL